MNMAMWAGEGLMIDHRFGPDIIEAMRDDGLEVAG